MMITFTFPFTSFVSLLLCLCDFISSLTFFVALPLHFHDEYLDRPQSPSRQHSQLHQSLVCILHISSSHRNRSSMFWSACLSSTAHALQCNEQISNLGCFDVTNSPFVHFFESSASINKTVTGLCTFLLDKNVYHECAMLQPDLLTKKARQPSVFERAVFQGSVKPFRSACEMVRKCLAEHISCVTICWFCFQNQQFELHLNFASCVEVRKSAI